jgi:DoxX-like family
MKKDKIIYWTCTGLFAAFMLFSAIPDLLMSADAVKFIGDLGYPDYFIPFIGFAKILGSIAILIPGLNKLKEWAYAGLTFDLIGAVYSIIRTYGFDPGMLVMVLVFAALALSYRYNAKLHSARFKEVN